MQQIITNEQEFDLKLSFITGGGSPATVDGAPSWSNSNDSVITVTPAEDGLSAVVSSVSDGTATISIAAKTPSGKDVNGSFDVTVTGAEAEVAVFTVENIRLKVVSDGTNTPE